MSNAFEMVRRCATHQRAYPLREPACSLCGAPATEATAKGYPRCYECAQNEMVDELRRRGAA